MKILKQVAWLYTLYEVDDGTLSLELMLASKENAFANYDKNIPLTKFEIDSIRSNINSVDSIVNTKLMKFRYA
jgi:hypothetical protein